MSQISRYPLIDIIRFTGIILMIIFHLAWDLNVFQYVQIDFNKDPFWYWLPRFIVTLFLISMGMSLALVHKTQIKRNKILKRFLKIIFFALLISVFTYFAFPKNWIYFGTLHCIAFSTILALPFLKTPKLNLFIFLTLFSAFWIFDLKFTPWSKSLGIVSMDYIPLHPWLGMVLLGISFVHFGLHKKWQSLKLPILLTWCSRHSLKIYLLHQGILYGIVYLFSYLTR